MVLSTTVFWAVMIGLLIDREIVPYFEYQSSPSYQTMLAKVEEPTYRRYEVFMGGTRIGDAEELVAFESGPLYVIENRIRFDLSSLSKNLFGGVRLLINARTEVNLTFELERFRSTMSLGPGLRMLTNAYREGDRLEITYRGLGLNGSKQMDFPSGMMLVHNFVPYQGNRYLAVGQKWRIQMIEFNWLGQEPGFVSAYVSVEERQTRIWQGREEDVYRVEIRRKPTEERVDYSAWVMRDGTVLESLTTFGRIEVTTRLVEQRILTEEEFIDFLWVIPQSDSP